MRIIDKERTTNSCGQMCCASPRPTLRTITSRSRALKGGEIEKKVITYSTNVFLPITNLCRNRCSYCGFRKDQDEAWFLSPEEIVRLAELGKELGCSEALITLGEKPEVHEVAREKLEEFGYSSTIEYLEDLCKRILAIGLLPHTNAGVLEERELKRLRRYNASMGLMLECIADLPAHALSPGKRPLTRFRVIETAGKLRIPFTTGVLVGIGETPQARVESILAIRDIHRKYGHIQEIIIQPFVPHPRTPMENYPTPAESDFFWVVQKARSIVPEMSIQVPPNLLTRWGPIEEVVREAVWAGANDFGGISPFTPDFINPSHPWPSMEELENAVRACGFILRERLPIYPEYAVDPRFTSPEVRAVLRELADEEGYRARQA